MYKEIDFEELHERFFIIMKRTTKTFAQMAREMGVSKQVLHLWVSGNQRTMYPSNAFKLVNYIESKEKELGIT